MLLIDKKLIDKLAQVFNHIEHEELWRASLACEALMKDLSESKEVEILDMQRFLGRAEILKQEHETVDSYLTRKGYQLIKTSK